MAPLPDHFTDWLNTHLDGFDAVLGLCFLEAGPERMVAEMTVGPQHTQPFGLVHGGVYAALIETLCSAGGAITVLDRGLTVVGLDNHTSFHRATRAGAQLVGTATPIKTGRRTQLWRADIVDEAARLVASGQVRLMVVDPQADLGGATLLGEATAPS
jgi:uncharacterized protein (TIGR00369 family)